MVSRTRPSRSERFSGRTEAWSSGDGCLLETGELVQGPETRVLASVCRRDSRGESKRGCLGVLLLNPSRSPFSWKGSGEGCGGVLVGLRSRPLISLRKGATLQGSVAARGGGVAEGILLGVEEMGRAQSISLTGVLKGPPSPWEQLRWDTCPRGHACSPKGRQCPSTNGSEPLLGGRTRTGSSAQGRDKCCFLRDLPASCRSRRLITRVSDGSWASGGVLRAVNGLSGFAGSAGRTRMLLGSTLDCTGSSFTDSVGMKEEAHPLEWQPSLSCLMWRPAGKVAPLL